MEWFFLLIAYLPFVSLVIGLALLIAGFLCRKSKRQRAKRFFIAGGCWIGIGLFVWMALFLAGALGAGPVPG